jgi:hypothetical protein
MDSVCQRAGHDPVAKAIVSADETTVVEGLGVEALAEPAPAATYHSLRFDRRLTMAVDRASW